MNAGMPNVYELLSSQGFSMRGVLAALHGARVVELQERLTPTQPLRPLTLQDEEGRRIYERSLRFVMLLAVRRLLPGQQVRIEYSIGHGVFVRLPGAQVDDALMTRLTEEMNAITAADQPFVREVWSARRCMEYFAGEGQQDKLDLLSRSTAESMPIYGCGGMWEYFYGAMTPSTGYVRVFGLTRRHDGFVLRLPTADSPDTPAPYVDVPKHLRIFQQSADWCEILGVTNASDLAALTEQKRLRFFIRVNEALHEQAIGAIARDIVSQGRRIVLVAGPSSSGKTTFAGRLAVQLQVLGRRAYRLSLDDYYLNRCDIPREADGSMDLEAITTLDLPLLREHMRGLLRGDTVETPRFSFRSGKREPVGVPLTLGRDELVIIEGIHGLNPQLSEGLPHAALHRVYVSALTCINLDDHNRIRTTDVRLLRRMVRDQAFRGTPPEETLAMWPSVRRGEEKWILPYQEQADSMFNTALHYELPVLKHFAYPCLLSVPDTTPGYPLVSRLLKTLRCFPDIDERVLDEVPPLSLLREFIGGCTMDEN